MIRTTATLKPKTVADLMAIGSMTTQQAPPAPPADDLPVEQQPTPEQLTIAIVYAIRQLRKRIAAAHEEAA